MNKIYKLVWSKVRNMWVVASEFAKSHSKSHSSVIGKKPLHIGLLLALVSGSVMTVGVQTVQAETTPEQRAQAEALIEAIRNDESLSRQLAASIESSFLGDGNGNIKLPYLGISTNYSYLQDKVAVAKGGSSIALGYGSNANTLSVAIGAGSLSKMNASALGYEAKANDFATALGMKSNASGQSSIAIGAGARGYGSPDSATSSSYGSIAIGTNSKVETNSDKAISIGLASKVTSDAAGAVALGAAAKAEGETSIVIGAEAHTFHGNSIAIGSNTETLFDGTTALGKSAKATRAGAIALGSYSEAERPKGTQGKNFGDTSVDLTSSTWKSTSGVVAIGGSSNNITRQLTGLAAGSEDSDAVNVAQLQVVNAKVDKNAADITTINDKITNLTTKTGEGAKYYGVKKPKDAATEQTEEQKLKDVDENYAGGANKYKKLVDPRTTDGLGKDTFDRYLDDYKSTKNNEENGGAREFGDFAAGYGAYSNGEMATATGYKATAISHSTANGAFSFAGGGSYAGGYGATATVRSVALGLKSHAASDAVAVGNDAKSRGDSVAIGGRADATKVSGVAVGFDAKLYGENSVAVGRLARGGEDSVSIGHGAYTEDKGTAFRKAVAVGVSASVTGNNGVAMGAFADAKNEFTTAVGNAAFAAGSGSSAFGTNTEAWANGSVAIGSTAVVTKEATNAVAVGASAKTEGSHGTALGAWAKTEGSYGTALGTSSNVSGYLGTAVGAWSVADQEKALALGYGAEAKVAGGAALGADSVATTAAGEVGYTSDADQAKKLKEQAVLAAEYDKLYAAYQNAPDNSTEVADAKKKLQDFTAQHADFMAAKDGLATWRATDGAISVGDSANHKTRQITNVAAGTQDTDAVNVAQLKVVNTKVDKNAADITTINTNITELNTKVGEGVHYFSVNDANSKGDNYDNKGATGKDSIAIGKNTKSSGNYTVAVGNNAEAAAMNAVAVGWSAKAKERFGVAIGQGAVVSAAEGVAIGTSAEVAVTKGVAIGPRSYADRNPGMLGYAPGVKGNDLRSIIEALGLKDRFQELVGIATPFMPKYLEIGEKFNKASAEGDTAAQEAAMQEMNQYKADHPEFTQALYELNTMSNTWQASESGVAIGDSRYQNTRQLTGVAAGTKDTDAVNVAQLKLVNTKVDKNAADITTINTNIKNLTQNAGNKIHYLAIGPDNEKNLAQGGNYNNDGVEQHWGIAIGVDASSKEGDGIAMGATSRARGYESIGLGSLSSAVGDYTTATGHKSQAFGDSASAFGTLARAYGANGVAIGGGALVSNSKSLTKAEYDALTEEEKALYHTEKTQQKEFYQYKQKDASGEIKDIEVNGVAIGNFASSIGYGGVSVGNFAKSMGKGGVAIGDHAKASDKDNIQNSAWGVALGAYSQNKVQQGVAIGTLSVADRAKDVKGYLPTTGKSIENFEEVIEVTGKTETFNQFKKDYATATAKLNEAKTAYEANTADNTLKTAFEQAQKKVDDLTNQAAVMTAPWISTKGAVSVGNEKQGKTRQIIGVAAGSEDTDAVNVAQLKALNTKVDNGAIHYVSVTAIDKSQTVDSNYFNDGAKGDGGIAIGQGATSQGRGIAMGYKSSATPVGATLSLNSFTGIAIGEEANMGVPGGIAIGLRSKVEGTLNTQDGNVNEEGTVALGTDAYAKGNGAAAFGWKAKGIGQGAMAFGTETEAKESGTAFGAHAIAAAGGVAMGWQAHANDRVATSVGTSSDAAKQATAVGAGTTADGIASTAVGLGAVSKGVLSTALGAKSVAEEANSIALGAGAVANTKAGAVGYIATGGSATFEEALATLDKKEDYDKWTTTVNALKAEYDNLTKAFNDASKDKKDEAKAALDAWKGQHADFIKALTAKEKLEATWRATKAAVSVGVDGMDAAGNRIIESRQITNVAAGTNDTDAVNVAQLKVVNTKVDQNKTDITNLKNISGKVIDGTNTTVTEGMDKDGKTKTYAVNVAADGQIADGNTGIVTGDTVYKFVNPIKTQVTNMETTVNKLKGGFTLKDTNNGTVDVALGETKPAITFKAETKNDDEATSALTATVDDKKNVIYTLNTKKLKEEMGLTQGVGSMSSWKLKAGTTDAQAIVDGDEVEFAVETADKGLTVKRDGKKIQYGINADKLVENINSATTKITNVDGDNIDLSKNTSIKTINENITKMAGKATKVTVDNKDDNSDDADASLKITKKTVDGQTTYNLSLNDKITIGKAGENGKDGKIGLNGKDGHSADISVGKGKDGVDGTNGENGITRIIYKDQGNQSHEVATLDDGLKFKGDNNDVVIRKLNTQLNITGGATAADLSDGNIGVVGTPGDDGGLAVKLSKKLKGLTSAEFVDGDNITNITGGNISITKKVNNQNETKNIDLWDLSTTVNNFKGGFTIKDAANSTVDVALGEATKPTITFKAETKDTEGATSAFTATVDTNKNVTYTLNTKKLKEEMGLNNIGTGTMSSWKLKVGNESTDISNGNEVTFAASTDEAMKGLSVKKEGKVITYGINKGELVSNIAGDIITEINKTTNKITNVDWSKFPGMNFYIKGSVNNGVYTPDANADSKWSGSHIVFGDGIKVEKLKDKDNNQVTRISLDGTGGTVTNGKSAYEIWEAHKDKNGNQPNKGKDEQAFLDSLKGKDGSGADIDIKDDATSGVSVTSTTEASKKTYTIGLGTKIKAGEVTIDGTKDKESATIGDVKIDGTANQGTITGLSNTKWDGQRIVSGRAATEDQLQQATETIQHHMVEMGQRVDHVGAKSAALAALHPLDYDADDKWDFSAAVGNYNGTSSVALGAFYRPNERTMISMGGTVGGEDNMVNLGVSFKTGSGVDGQVYTSRTAMAKEIKALKEKEAARDAVLQQMAEREAVKDAEITKLKEKDAQREEQLRKLIALVTAMQHK